MVKFLLQIFLISFVNNLFLICAHSLDFDECGISGFEPNMADMPQINIGTNHVYKGQAVDDAKALPWMVSLHLGGTFFCTGTIIGPRHILTAYHCVKDKTLIQTYIHVSYGTVNVSQHGYKANTKSFKIHPNSSYSSLNINLYGHKFVGEFVSNDLAVIEIKEEIEFTPNVRPILVVKRHSEMYQDKMAEIFSPTFVIAGWGLTQPSCQLKPIPKLSDQLMYGKMRIISVEKDGDLDENTNETNDLSDSLPFVHNTKALLMEHEKEAMKNLIWVVPEPSIIEKGDSGGPLMGKIGKNNGWVQVGIASITSCDPKNPQSTNGLTSKYAPIDCDFIETATDGEVKCTEQ